MFLAVHDSMMILQCEPMWPAFSGCPWHNVDFTNCTHLAVHDSLLTLHCAAMVPGVIGCL